MFEVNVRNTRGKLTDCFGFHKQKLPERQNLQRIGFQSTWLHCRYGIRERRKQMLPHFGFWLFNIGETKTGHCFHFFRSVAKNETRQRGPPVAKMFCWKALRFFLRSPFRSMLRILCLARSSLWCNLQQTFRSALHKNEEFVDTIEYKWHTTVYQVYPSAVPARKVLYPRWFFRHKIQVLRLPKVSRLNYKCQARYVIIVITVNYIPRYDFVLNNKLKWFKGFLRRKMNVQRVWC